VVDSRVGSLDVWRVWVDRGEASAHDRAARRWIPVAALAVLFLALPVLLVLVLPGTDDQAFQCRARIESRLAQTLGGKLEFLLVTGTGGRPPAEEFVIAVDHGYTSGLPNEAVSGAGSAVQPGMTIWLQGTLMDRDTYFGEQYLFFGYPQLYVDQIKTGAFWPSQVERLGSLYLSPVATVLSLYLVWAFPFMEEYELGSWLLIVARFVLLCGAIAAVLLWGKRGPRVAPRPALALLLYCIAATVLATPSL